MSKKEREEEAYMAAVRPRSGWTRAGGTLTDRRELGAPTAGRGGEVGEASRGRTYHRGEGRSPAGS